MMSYSGISGCSKAPRLISEHRGGVVEMSRRLNKLGLTAGGCMTGPRLRWENRTVRGSSIRPMLIWFGLPICCLLVHLIPARAQSGRYSDVRALVGRVQQDLRRAAGMA